MAFGDLEFGFFGEVGLGDLFIFLISQTEKTSMSKGPPSQSVQLSDRCEGKKKDGRQCRLYTTTDGLCWMHGQMEEKVRVKPSQITGAGKGLFASEWDHTSRGKTKPKYKDSVVFKTGEKITAYEGDVLDADEFMKRYPQGDAQYSYSVDPDHIIDSRRTTSCFGRYANNSLGSRTGHANARITHHRDSKEAYLVATEPIKQDRELLVN